jgi:hypothetical protein
MYLLETCLAVSVIGNIGALFFVRKPKKTQRIDVTAQQLLNDLTERGSSLVRIERIAPTDVFLRSPKQ